MAKKKVVEEVVSGENMEEKREGLQLEEIIDNEEKNKVVFISTSQSSENSSLEESAEEATIAQKLLSLYNLQQIFSQIDKIRVIRGELPNEVRDLEDAFEGMQTRIKKYTDDISELETKVVGEETKTKEYNALIKRYEEQQNNVRNNREYESLEKEIEYQKLEIKVSEKHKAKFQADIIAKKEEITEFENKLNEISDVLQHKKNELEDIITDTEKEELELLEKAELLKAKVEHRLLAAFERIRKNARNGLAIVQIERDACGGCFSMIPPQKQLDIRLHKKIIVCEACGRIFIDHQLVESQKDQSSEIHDIISAEKTEE